MPVEIRELLIRARVDREPERQDQPPAPDAAAEDRAAIVEECVRQVLRILDRAQER